MQCPVEFLMFQLTNERATWRQSMLSVKVLRSFGSISATVLNTVPHYGPTAPTLDLETLLTTHSSFLLRTYPTMKKHNPHIPILIREAQDVEPKVWARYGVYDVLLS
jgi:hypothetical protein